MLRTLWKLLTCKKVKVKIMYHGVPEIKKIKQGDWIDLYTSENVAFGAGAYGCIPLGVSMQLPKGYEALVVPRSSTFKKYGLIMANSMGVIDESYNGESDVWGFPAYATRDVDIPKHTRICQFRIVKHQPAIKFERVEALGNVARGGFGSTGK